MSIPRSTDRAVNDAFAVLLASMVASLTTMAAYAAVTLFSSAFLGADLPVLGAAATTAALGAAVLSVGLAAAARAFRDAPRR
ncbi:hypothetical protein [Methylorubrum aminovorans]